MGVKKDDSLKEVGRLDRTCGGCETRIILKPSFHHPHVFDDPKK